MSDLATIPRRKLTTLDKLKIVARQARCPICREKLGPLEGLDWDHEHALARGGTDTLDNIRAVHRHPCHARKTAKVDIPEAAKTKRLTASEAEFRARLLTKQPGEKKPASKWPKRKMQSRGWEKRP